MNRKISFIALLVFILALGLTAAGCDLFDAGPDKKDNKSGVSRTLSSIDITDATNLFIAPDESGGGAAADRLFKITDDGYVEEVTYTYKDNTGNVVTLTETFTPYTIIILSADYLLVDFGLNGGYLVNSGTGACYKYTKDWPVPENKTTYYNSEHIGTDKDGNIYFVTTSSIGDILKKLTITDIDKITISTVSAPNETVRNFGVDIDGNIAYNGFDSGKNDVLRYRKNTGGSDNLPGPTNYFTMFWTGFNGKLYYYNSGFTSRYIKELSAEPYTATDYGTDDWRSDFNPGIGIHDLLRIKNAKRIIGYNKDSILEIYNETTNNATAVPISTFGLSEIKFGIASDNYYYLAGKNTESTPKNVLVKINPLDNSYTTPITGGYDIYKMTDGSDDIVTFNALQMANDAVVVGQVTPAGLMAILDVTLTREVTVLERIR